MPKTIFFPGEGSNSSEVHLGRMLQILREFSTDQILSFYVIDDVWEYMKAMKVLAFRHTFRKRSEPRREVVVIPLGQSS